MSYYYNLIESKIYLLETEIMEKTEELKRLQDLKNYYDKMNEEQSPILFIEVSRFDPKGDMRSYR